MVLAVLPRDFSGSSLLGDAPETPWGIGQIATPSTQPWESKAARHGAMKDASNIKRSSRDNSPDSTASRPHSRQFETSASMMWLDRKPQEFMRMVRKSASEPLLADSSKLPKLGKGTAGSGVTSSETDGSRPRRRREGGAKASDVIAAQKRNDAEKEAKDLADAERRAYRMRQEHCMLVNQRKIKETKVQALVEKAEVAANEAAAKALELEVLRARLAMLEEEAHELEHELQLEIDTTPR